MAAVVVTLADAVVDVLNAASLSRHFVAERAYAPLSELEQITGLTVWVMASRITTTIQSRGADEYEYAVDIGVFQRIGSGAMTQAEIKDACDPLVLLCQEIGDLFRSEAVRASLPARFDTLANEPVYDQALLDEKRLFASRITLRFKLARAR